MSNATGPTASELLQALPPVLQRDTRMNALGQIIADVLAERITEIREAEIYTRIDELDEALLDILADDLKVDWYGYDYPLATKRAVIKSSFYVHRHLGTKGAVEAAIQSLYPDSIVEEWFEYIEGGEPYHFRVVLGQDSSSVQISNTEILRAIGIYKDLRSHLDGIMFRALTQIEIQTTCGWIAYASRLCGTYPVQATHGKVYAADIVAETAKGGVAYANPYTGDIAAGQYPAPSTLGRVAAANAIAETDASGVGYTSPMTGLSTAGTEPSTAVQGSIDSGVLDASAAGASIVSDLPLCGTDFNFF